MTIGILGAGAWLAMTARRRRRLTPALPVGLDGVDRMAAMQGQRPQAWP